MRLARYDGQEGEYSRQEEEQGEGCEAVTARPVWVESSTYAKPK